MVSLNLKGVYKSFFGQPILKDLSFSFCNGLYCIVGPNGIGKSTILDLLAGVKSLDRGNIFLSSDNNLPNTSLAYKKKLCYVPGEPSFFPSSTGIEFLNFVMSIKGENNEVEINTVNELLNKFNVNKFINTKFDEMSLGTKKKLFLTTTLMGKNSLIILDEPTNGLDKESKKIFFELLSDLSGDAIIIMASHDEDIIDCLNPKIIKLNETPIRCFM